MSIIYGNITKFDQHTPENRCSFKIKNKEHTLRWRLYREHGEDPMAVNEVGGIK